MIERRGLLLGGAGFLAVGGGAAWLIGCNKTGASAPSPDDMVVGQANAPATLIEYASAVCPHCAEFHEAVWAQLKANYIDTGKLKYVFREYPTNPAPVAVAGFQLARCGGASSEQYMTRLGVIFEQQRNILQSGSMEGVRQKLVQIGNEAGLSEEQVMTCISDQEGTRRVQRSMEAGSRDFGITGTPTLILNGQKLDQSQDASLVTYEGLSRRIDAAIAGH